jgi:ribosomal protein L37AE/L43A
VTDRTESILESVAERVSRTECPFCGADDWVGPRLAALPTTEIGAYQSGRVEMKDLAVAIWICADCGFVRAHSIAPELFE